MTIPSVSAPISTVSVASGGTSLSSVDSFRPSYSGDAGLYSLKVGLKATRAWQEYIRQ